MSVDREVGPRGNPEFIFTYLPTYLYSMLSTLAHSCTVLFEMAPLVMVDSDTLSKTIHIRLAPDSS